MKRCFFLFVIWLYSISVYASHENDSLRGVWEDKTLADTTRLSAGFTLLNRLFNEDPPAAQKMVKAYYELSKKSTPLWQGQGSFQMAYAAFDDDRYQDAIYYYRNTINIYKRIHFYEELDACYGNLALSYLRLSEYDSAFNCYLEAGKHSVQVMDTSGYGRSVAQRGMVRDYQGRWVESLDLYYESLRVFELAHDEYSQSVVMANIASMYEQMRDPEKAKEYYQKTYALKKSVGDRYGEAIVLMDLADYDVDEKRFNDGLTKLDTALGIFSEFGSQRDISFAYQAKGILYAAKKEYSLAQENFIRAIKMQREIGLRSELARTLAGIGNLERDHNHTAQAISYCLEGYTIASEVGDLNEEKKNCNCLTQAYEQSGNAKEALRFYKRMSVLSDSLNNDEVTRKAATKEMEFGFAKQKLRDSLEQAQVNRIKDLQLREQEAVIASDRMQKNLLYGGIILVMIIAFLSIRSYLIKKKDNRIIAAQKAEVEMQKEIVEEQKIIVEEKNKEILDSINYAKRIQTAILPPVKLVKEYLQESFILYKPKDIVAGDFYWLDVVPGSASAAGCVLFAACDCTGHGVPGAMVSVVCHNALNRSVREFGLTEPGKILDKTREIVIAEFEKSDEEVKDGMDIALCVLKDNQLQFSGANNPLWLIRKSKDEGHETTSPSFELIEYKADKQPIGRYDKIVSFTTHHIMLQPGDSVYIFSDGYADQFGGNDQKKFKSSNFKKLLLSIQHESMENQMKIISDTFEKWKGNFEQIDDVCVIGLRFS